MLGERREAKVLSVSRRKTPVFSRDTHMLYAVIKSGGKQYKVEEGKELLLERKFPTETKNVHLDEVMLVANGETIAIGDPFVKGAKVQVSVVGGEKGEKIYVKKYKAKSRYRRTIGHRSQYTRVKVEKIIV